MTVKIAFVTIKFDKLYTPEMITEINTYIDNFINENITDEEVINYILSKYPIFSKYRNSLGPHL